MENRNETQRKYRHKTRNWCTKKYEKTKNGFLMRMYRNMKSRVLGIQKKKAHLYFGKDLIEKELFYSIAKNSEDFNRLFVEWELSGYDRRLTPSVDRIDTDKGYTEDNIRFITHSENSRIAGYKTKKDFKIINGNVL